MYFSLISNRLTKLITQDLNYNDDQKEIIDYAIETILLFIAGASLIVLFGLGLKALAPTVIAAVFGGLLRKVSGGAHFNSPLKCIVSGAIVYSFIGFLAKNVIINNLYSKNILLIIVFFSFLIVAVFSPVDSESKPIHSRNLRFKLKISSIIFVVITFLMVTFANENLLSFSAVLGVFYQSITLLPIFNKKGGGYSL